jgi:hypothetical protein
MPTRSFTKFVLTSIGIVSLTGNVLLLAASPPRPRDAPPSNADGDDRAQATNGEKASGPPSVGKGRPPVVQLANDCGSSLQALAATEQKWGALLELNLPLVERFASAAPSPQATEALYDQLPAPQRSLVEIECRGDVCRLARPRDLEAGAVDLATVLGQLHAKGLISGERTRVPGKFEMFRLADDANRGADKPSL